MKTSTTIKYLTLGAMAVTLFSCGDTTKKETKPLSQQAVSSLAYQATTSLAVMADMNMNMNVSVGFSSPRALMKKVDTVIDEAKKAQIEELLPTVDLLMKNNNNFKSEILTSDREGYNHKQVVSFFDINNEETSYTLYYNLGSDQLTEDDLITNPSDEVVDPNAPSEEIVDPVTPSEETVDPVVPSEEVVDPSESTEVAPEQTKKLAKDESEDIDEEDKEDESDDEENDEEDEDEEDNEIETATTFEGIAVVGEDEFSFQARSTEEIEDEETEKEFELRINQSENSYIEVVHEVETEDLEVEEEYRYTIVENDEIVHEFEFEQERETEDNKEENKVKLVINNEKFSFKFYEEEGIEYIRVKYDNKSEDEGKIIYKKVVDTLEDGSEQVHFEEVK